MGYQKLQVGNAMSVVASDTIKLPKHTGDKQSGTATGTTSSKLVDSGGDFTTSVRIGAIVINTTDSTIATVTAIDSDTTLSLSGDIMASGEAYTIYNDEEKGGAVIYVGTTGNLKVTLTGGDTVTLIAAPAGSFFPMQVIQVHATGTSASDILAFW